MTRFWLLVNHKKKSYIKEKAWHFRTKQSQGPC